MADNEDIQTEDVSENQPPQSAGTTVEDTVAGAGDSAGVEESAAEQDDTDYKSEYTKLQESQKELQAKLTQTAQEAAKNKQLLETISPYVDYTKLHGPGAGAPAEGDEEDEDDQSYVTPSQVKKIVGNLETKFKQQLIAQNVRAKFPDVFDNGPVEKIGLHFLATDTSIYDNPEERALKAAEKTREYIKSIKEKGRKEAEAERAKTEAEAKAKAVEAAKASGLSSTGTPSPSTTTEAPELTGESYVEQRRNRRAKTQSVSP